MRIDTCYFCSRPAYPSKGITFCRNDGKAFRFCRSKCHKNFKMKRNPRKLKWTKAFRKSAGKEMVVDSTLQFAARRHVPIRYDRELWQKTMSAMTRIQAIREKRERAFYMKRMRGNRSKNLGTARKLVADNEHLLPKLRGSAKRKLRLEGATEAEIVEVEKALIGKQKEEGVPVQVFGGAHEKEKEKKRVKIMLGVDGGEHLEVIGARDDGWADEDTMDLD